MATSAKGGAAAAAALDAPGSPATGDVGSPASAQRRSLSRRLLRRSATEDPDAGGAAGPSVAPLPTSASSPAVVPTTAAAEAAANSGFGVVLFSGWCVKRRKGLVMMWRKRFVVLTTAGHLLYFKTEKAEKQRGVVDLRRAFDLLHGHACDALTDWPSDRPVGCRLQLEAMERTLYLVAESLTAASRWMELLELMRSYATNPCVTDLLSLDSTAGGAASARLKAMVPCSHGSFLRLNLLARVAGNDRCADCWLRGTTWVCCKLGVFLCMRCAGLHRRLATDNAAFLCDVRSLELGDFSEKLILGLELCGGNRRAEAVLEPQLPQGFRRPAESNERMLGFLRAKYADGVFSDGGVTALSIDPDAAALGPAHMATVSFSDADENSGSEDEGPGVAPSPPGGAILM